MPAKKSKAAPAKAPAKNGAKKAAKPEKGGALGSIKKMLGLGADKKAAAAKGAAPKKGAEKVAEKPAAKGAKPGKAAAPVKGAQPAADKKGAADQPAPRSPGRPPKGDKAKGSLENLPGRSLLSKPEPVAHGSSVCREVACELMSTTGGYCRMHYIKNWKKIKRKELILKEKKLNSYIEELVSKYPDKYIEAIRQDLASEKDFAKVIADLEIEEGLDDFESVETESAEGIIDNLKRDFDDEGDVF